MGPEGIAPIFLKDGKPAVRKVGRAGSMIKMREELRKLKNQRMKAKTRSLKENDFNDMEIGQVKRSDYTRRMDRGILRSDSVPSKLLQDKSNRIQVIGADVEALYPSLSAMEVGDIIYNAMLNTKIKFDNMEWLEACTYIVLTSTEQECRLGPLRGCCQSGPRSMVLAQASQERTL